jgi:3-deoxy-D-manno-octulosonic-acid transferase
MSLFYSFGILLYGLAIRLAALFNKKASLWVEGRRNLFPELTSAMNAPSLQRNQHKLVWFHCASLGEFEQGRPLMESFRVNHPEYIILLTFFSPSGFELRKNYTGADLIFYLPLDTPGNATLFLDTVKPDIVFFVKYEFWFNYLRLLQKASIPHYLVSAIFRADQHFFTWYGDWPRKILRGFTHIFVQNQYSRELLEFVDIPHVTVSGDTRFDRVVEIAAVHKDFPIVQNFTADQVTLVAGSTWLPDEDLLEKYIMTNNTGCKLIIAPHEIKATDIISLSKRFGNSAILYSQADPASISQYRILIIDSIGMLSQLYRYGQIAYIGGGFGAGIHNILEAAVYGMPVLFGPNYHKFQEATDLVERKGAFVIHNYSDLEKLVTGFLFSRDKMSEAASISRIYVNTRNGATQRILAEVHIP